MKKRDKELETVIEEDIEETSSDSYEETEVNNDIFDKRTKQKTYYSFENRIFTFVILIIVCLACAGVLFGTSVELSTNKVVNYNESSNVDYKVYLKQNDFYDKDYLDKDMVYVASLINKVDVKFNYLFRINDNSDIDFDYDIVGKLKIADTDGSNVFFEKDYVLLKKQKDSIKNKTEYQISKNLKIDYGFYNDLANKFKNNYGIDAESSLEVFLNVHKKGSNNNDLRLDNESKVSLLIPLSKKAINIKLARNDLNRQSQATSEKTCSITNYKLFLLGLVMIILTLILVVCVLRFISKSRKNRSEYDKYVAKILNEYDRLIVETSTAPITKDKDIVDVKEFKELLDVRDNLNLPIKYHIISEHHKCEFYISHEEEVYILTIKDVDIDNKPKKFFSLK